MDFGKSPWLSSPGKNTLGSCFKYHRCSVKMKPCLLWNTANLGRETGQVCDAGFFRPVFLWLEQRGERTVGSLAVTEPCSGESVGWHAVSLHRRICAVAFLASCYTDWLFWWIYVNKQWEEFHIISIHFQKKGNSCVPCLQVAWTWTFFCWGGQQRINSNWSVHKVDGASVNSCLVFPVGLRKLVSGA